VDVRIDARAVVRGAVGRDSGIREQRCITRVGQPSGRIATSRSLGRTGDVPGAAAFLSHPRTRGINTATRQYRVARPGRRLELVTIAGYILAVLMFISAFVVIASWISRVAAP
jgi:hypothetical protein